LPLAVHEPHRWHTRGTWKSDAVPHPTRRAVYSRIQFIGARKSDTLE